MASEPFDVAIVGGGASGTLLAIQLLRKALHASRFLLLDREGDFARGLAYRTRDPNHLLNVPAFRMSALPDDEDHFLLWLRARAPAVGPEVYAQRQVYGDYLSESLLAAERQATAGAVLERRSEEVLDVEDDVQGVRLRLDSGGEVVARRAVLALGNPPPARLPSSSETSSRIWQWPWPRDASWPDPDATVVLVGAGLTAVDVLLSLSARGHRGQFHVLSRHGRFPNAHDAVTLPPSEIQLPRGKLRPLVRTLRELAKEASPNWRLVVDSIRLHAHDLWRSLSDVERRRFARHVRSIWEIHRHRLAPSAAAKLNTLLATGQLQLHAGRLVGLFESASSIEVKFRRRGSSLEQSLAAQLVVNCTGPAGHVSSGDALIGALLQHGRVRPGPLGLGLSADVHGALLDVQGNTNGRMWALGPLRRGDVWESTAVPDIRIQAAELAERLSAL